MIPSPHRANHAADNGNRNQFEEEVFLVDIRQLGGQIIGEHVRQS
jgi:hypothetical protein